MPPEARALAYFDTSVLVKRYVTERGAARARALLQKHRFLSSAVMPVEAVSALDRRRAAGDLSRASFDAILTQLTRDRLHWALVEVTSGVLDRAEVVIRETGVRTLDAIHLASALHGLGSVRHPSAAAALGARYGRRRSRIYLAAVASAG